MAAEFVALPDHTELVTAAQTMLIGALWGDAMAREMRDDPNLWVPETRAAQRYVQMFLRAIAVSGTPHRLPVVTVRTTSTPIPSLS